MKFLFSLFTIVMLAESCNSNKEVVSDSKETEQVVASKPSREAVNLKQEVVGDNYEKVLITYQALSRGTFEYVQISKAQVIISEDRNLKEMSTYNCKSQDWVMLEELIEKIDIENLNKLSAPTNKRLHDGAAHANLAIIKGDVEMMTPTFDHGVPPKEIEALVNKVLSVKENAVKQ
ncbi:hypothetical protein [uncultured Winogradskyella sp.]|uniref:hypothetical protein n=1 Tax=uncultured Winogradskyella sp. TaxID=395353 RepID=UPI00262B0C82|nr:hypothetical protein [uncultured Winogradskyella sp.]